jgi:NTP pyrophosphatase (non-canonical NTP hydrolase)
MKWQKKHTKNKMGEIQEITKEIIKFRDKRNWNQFHNTKDLALAISIEVAELNELFLWKDKKESEKVDIEKIKEELADVLTFSFLLAYKHKIKIKEIILKKLKKNDEKYPVNKAKNSSLKYTEL